MQVYLSRYYLPILLKSYKPGQNIWEREKKASKIGKEQKTLITDSAQFLTTITKVILLEGTLGTKLYVYPILTFS